MFSGCVSSTHLKDLMVVEGMGIDGNRDEVMLYVQTLRAEAATGGDAPTGNMTVITNDKGKSIFEASANLSKNLSKKIFYGHNKLIIFGDELCKTDFQEKIDYFLRSSDSRVDVPVCISKTKAADIINSKENSSEIPVENVAALIKNGQREGLSAYVTINDVLNMYSDKTTDFYLPVLEKTEDKDNVSLAGIGIFDGGKLVYTMNDDETLGLMIIRNKIKSCSIEFDDKEFGRVGVMLYEPSIKNEAFCNNGTLVFKSTIKAQLMINELEKGILTSLTPEKAERICDEADKRIISLCYKAFNVCRRYNSDCIRVGEYVARDCPLEYNRVKNDWKKEFKLTDYSVDVDTKLKKIGNNTQLE